MIPKFRAWDKRSKTMEIIDDMYWFEENSIHNDKDAKFVDIIIMQSTGLKDKNGKEIFEGDIVNVLSENRLVEWWCSGWAVRGVRLTPSNLKSTLRGLKVIGNIHENPKLIRRD